MSRRSRGRRRLRGRIMNRPQKQGSLMSRIFHNRYRPDSNWVRLADVIANVKETVFCFLNRVPAGSRLTWRKGKITGFSSTWNGPR